VRSIPSYRLAPLVRLRLNSGGAVDITGLSVPSGSRAIARIEAAGSRCEGGEDMLQNNKVPETSVLGVQNRRTAADRYQTPSVMKRAEIMPVLYRAAYLRAVSGKASPRSAIKAFCLECMGWQRIEVGNCTATACPLFAYRPYQSEEQGAAS